MSIHGVNPALAGLGLPIGGARERVPEEPRPQPTPRPVTTPADTRRAVPAVDVPAEAPPGTDPELWSVLTTEERAFFAKAREMGPLTYGPGSKTPTDVPVALQGGRIDVRV